MSNISKAGIVNADYLIEDVDLSEAGIEDEQTTKLASIGSYPLLTDKIETRVGEDYIVVREFIEW